MFSPRKTRLQTFRAFVIKRLSKDNSCLGINWYDRCGCIKIKIQIRRRFEMSRAELRHKHWDLIQLCVTTYLSQPLGNCWESRNTCKRIQIQGWATISACTIGSPTIHQHMHSLCEYVTTAMIMKALLSKFVSFWVSLLWEAGKFF